MNSLQKLDYLAFKLAKDKSVCFDFDYTDESTPVCADCPYYFDGICHYDDGWDKRTDYIKRWLLK